MPPRNEANYSTFQSWLLAAAQKHYPQAPVDELRKGIAGLWGALPNAQNVAEIILPVSELQSRVSANQAEVQEILQITKRLEGSKEYVDALAYLELALRRVVRDRADLVKNLIQLLPVWTDASPSSARMEKTAQFMHEVAKAHTKGLLTQDCDRLRKQAVALKQICKRLKAEDRELLDEKKLQKAPPKKGRRVTGKNENVLDAVREVLLAGLSTEDEDLVGGIDDTSTRDARGPQDQATKGPGNAPDKSSHRRNHLPSLRQ